MYQICSAGGKIFYIGETCNLARRSREHVRSGKISVSRSAPGIVEYKIADRRSSAYTRRFNDQKKIAKHKLPPNGSKGGEVDFR